MNQKEKQLRKDYQKYVLDGGEDPWGIWCFKGAKYEDLKPYAQARIASNKSVNDERSKWVNGEIGGKLLDKGYLKLAQVTKELKKSLEIYTGDKGLASDLLFKLSKKAEIEEKDFSVRAEKKLDEMKGINNPESTKLEFVDGYKYQVKQKTTKTLEKKSALKKLYNILTGKKKK